VRDGAKKELLDYENRIVWSEAFLRATEYRAARDECTKRRTDGVPAAVGHWRLPNTDEVRTLVDALHRQGLPGRLNDARGSYWTDNEDACFDTMRGVFDCRSGPLFQWTVRTPTGTVRQDLSSFGAICVRDFYDEPFFAFETKASFSVDEVADLVRQRSGPIWQRTASAESFTFEQAVKHCQELKIGDLTSWHLPRFADFVRIHRSEDRKIMPPDPNLFPVVKDQWIWIDEFNGNGPNYRWKASFATGQEDDAQTSEQLHVRCVHPQ
jgi:hypothetical protein